ncbi:MAG: signal peptidase II [Gammaproteobacteria bacterium]
MNGNSPVESVRRQLMSGSNGLPLLWWSLFIILLDQATKLWIVAAFQLYERLPVLPFMELTRLHNTGAAFSFLAGAGGWQRWFFTALAVVVSIGITLWLRQLQPRQQPLLAVGLASIMGGAIGNVIDRLLHGHVIDFLHFHWGERWWFPAFNVADIAITTGAGLIILDALLESRRST